MERRHRSALTVLAIVVLLAGLFAAGLYGADRWAQQRIERQAAENLQIALATAGEPDVSIDGFPFLSQVAARHVRQMHVVADDLGLTGDNALAVAHLDLLLTDVMTTDWFETMTASHADGTALVDYSVLERAATVPLSYAGEGRIRMETTTTLLGAKVVAQITGLPRSERKPTGYASVWPPTMCRCKPEVSPGQCADALASVSRPPRRCRSPASCHPWPNRRRRGTCGVRRPPQRSSKRHGESRPPEGCRWRRSKVLNHARDAALEDRSPILPVARHRRHRDRRLGLGRSSRNRQAFHSLPLPERDTEPAEAARWLPARPPPY